MYKNVLLLTKLDAMKGLRSYTSKYLDDQDIPLTVENGNKLDLGTVADLVLRQYMNNGSDGFGMKQVISAARVIIEHFDKLIEWGLLSRKASNNFGMLLGDVDTNLIPVFYD